LVCFSLTSWCSVGLALLNRLFQRRYNASRGKAGEGRSGLSDGIRRQSPPPAPVSTPMPRDSKNIKKDSTNYHSLKRRFEQSAVSMASCGYSWVMASCDDGAWVPGNEIGKLEDLPREQGSRIVALARTSAHGNPRPLQGAAGECVVVANCTTYTICRNILGARSTSKRSASYCWGGRRCAGCMSLHAALATYAPHVRVCAGTNTNINIKADEGGARARDSMTPEVLNSSQVPKVLVAAPFASKCRKSQRQARSRCQGHVPGAVGRSRVISWLPLPW
jgi:hypothetical protein